MEKKRKIRIVWSCSPYFHHEHRYKWTAYLCGRLQYLCFALLWLESKIKTRKRL